MKTIFIGKQTSADFRSWCLTNHQTTATSKQEEENKVTIFCFLENEEESLLEQDL